MSRRGISLIKFRTIDRQDSMDVDDNESHMSIDISTKEFSAIAEMQCSLMLITRKRFIKRAVGQPSDAKLDRA